MTARNTLKTAGAVAGGLYMVSEGAGPLGIIGGAIVGGVAGSIIGSHIDGPNTALAQDVERLRLKEEKLTRELRVSKLEHYKGKLDRFGGDFEDELFALEADYHLIK